MLGKLLKYEWKSSGKITLLLNAYIVLITVLGLIVIKSGFFYKVMPGEPASQDAFSIQATIGALLIGAYFVSIIAVAAAVILFQVFRFYKNYYTDEGYLMHTLPVSSVQLILSKGLFATAVTLITGIVITLSGFFILFTASGPAEQQEFLQAVQTLIPSAAKEFGWPPAGVVLYMIVLAVLSCIHSILAFYASLSIGQRFTRHKIIGSIIAYAILNMAEQIVSLICMFIIGWNSSIINTPPDKLSLYMNKALLLSLIITLAVTTVYWFITDFMMKKRLNLE